MSDDQNRQFFFDRPVEQLSVLPKAKKLRKPLTVTGGVLIGAMVGSLLGGGIAVGGYYLGTSPTPVVVNNSLEVNWVSGASQKALPSVVTINVGSSTSGGSGSGVFLTADGYILTNTHVVTLDGQAKNPTVEVQTFDKRTYSATVIGTDPINDLAVIKIDSPMSFTPIEFADSSSLNIGDSVVAIGSPLGLTASVTVGVVSALNRTIAVANSSVPGENGSGLQLWNGKGVAPVSLRVIQTDAAINPGNSGGALVNSKGALVGINVAIASTGSSSSTAQSGNIGVGFSIPSNVAKRVADEIIKTGAATHALLGAMVTDQPFNANSSSSFSIGALIKEVTVGGPAESSGLKAGDLVTKFNGEPIMDAGDLTAAVRWEAAKTQATLEFVRDGKTQTMTVTLGTLK
ncbi:MAG: trypsin-like peptidase domain-containing protein [Rhodoluna sp.]|nr:trypsin-like peptidase domain-containing protein [Rhodoluna sp.]